MLDAIYSLGRLFMSKGWIAGLLVIVLTIGFGTSGFLATKWENGKSLSTSDALYKAASLLAIQTGSLSTSGNCQLELARWLGMLFFASALLTFAIRLSREAMYHLLVKAFAKNHIIIAGLGQHGAQLVEKLRATGQTVVVLEPNRNHPALDHCRRMGAIVLFGESDDTSLLRAANLPSASAILALVLEEGDCVRAATAAYNVLKSETATPAKPPVRCVLRLLEPGLLDAVRNHTIKTDSTDRFTLEILNSHEIAATTMVREAAANSPSGAVGKAIILGLGTHHRLGEMVVLRAVKDYIFARNRHDGEKLKLHVFDNQATDWLTTFVSRYPAVENFCTITPHRCWARRVGASNFQGDYDAAFVCIADEGHATAQAVMLRRDVLKKRQPIMVRVLHSRSGFGELIGVPLSGWGENIHPVGLEDSLVDPATATQPELEMRAQAIHHDYRARQKDPNEPANRPWTILSETFREANRKLAERYATHLAFTDGKHKTNAYRWVFQPDGFIGSTSPEDLLSPFNDDELESLAAREHQLWKEERERAGWRYGPEKDEERKTNPRLVEYDKLTDENKEYNREFVRSIPRLLTLADYVIVKDDSVVATPRPISSDA